MMLTSREFQFICLECFFLTSACLTITPSGSFEIDSRVNLTCTHQSYSGTQLWKVNAVEVLACNLVFCSEASSNPKRFMFENDRINGVFVFTIDPVLRSDKGSVVECNDGSPDFKTFNVGVKGCGRLPNITNGNVKLRDEKNTSFGAIADVVCNEGYEANTPTISCQENNTWSEAVCRKKGCGRLPNIKNGNVQLRDENNTSFGAIADVSCNKGYVANTSTISCQENNTWSEAVCRKKGTNSSEPLNETNPDPSPGITATVSLQITTPNFTINQLTVCPCPCWIIVIIIIVISRFLYAQAWLSGFSLYGRPSGIKDIRNEQILEIIMILLTGLPCIGLISSVWACFRTEQDHKCPKWFKWSLATGFIIGCIQPGFGLFITGTAYATYVQLCSVLLFTTVIFILLVGTELALIIVCTVLEIKCYYYILIAAGYIVVWIIVAAIMVKRVNTIYMDNGKTTSPRVTKGSVTTRESRIDDYENLNLDCTCDLCGNLVLHTLKGFCLEQNKLLCNSCFSKHKCRGKHLTHSQHEEGGRERYFQCENKQRKGHRHSSAHGYCLVCRLYLCTECLIDHDEHEMLWMPHHGAKTFDDICCFKTQTDRKSTTLLGFCKTCKMYMCKECMRAHKETHKEKPHITICHQHEGTQTNIENCSECSRPMECFKLNVNKYLCADCYDSGSLWMKNPIADEDSMTILKESKSCELHDEVGDCPAKYSPTDVFCIVCKLYLCKECFKVHRRFRERWIATHKENMFTCKACQEKNDVFPVECFSINSKSFLCAACFEENKKTSSRATEKYLRSETITRLSVRSDCELHKVPFQFEEREKSSTVYCLLCKTYMCDDCFRKHLRLKQVWTKREMKFSHQTKSRNNEVVPMQTSM